MNYCVVTTVNKPTKAIEELYKRFGYNLIIVGDKKTPDDWNYKGVVPIGAFTDKLYAPDNHYARKNLGYLAAIKNKAELIFDSDDDNVPNENWKIRQVECDSNIADSGGWFNVYQHFEHTGMWPRGFPLKRAISENYAKFIFGSKISSSIQQGLSNGEADVDAIHRLLFKKQVSFTEKRSVTLNLRTTWCPFNSQSTWWFPKAYPLMYLPVFASFRMTDIWRSFVAQRCLWELDEGVTFHSPAEVFQDRNEHDLLKDFEDEVPGYLKNDLIVEILGKLELKRGEDFVCENLLTCYRALIKHNILPEAELPSVEAWVEDYGNATRNMG